MVLGVGIPERTPVPCQELVQRPRRKLTLCRQTRVGVGCSEGPPCTVRVPRTWRAGQALLCLKPTVAEMTTPSILVTSSTATEPCCHSFFSSSENPQRSTCLQVLAIRPRGFASRLICLLPLKPSLCCHPAGTQSLLSCIEPQEWSLG